MMMRPGLFRDDLPALLALLIPVIWRAQGDPWLGPRLALCLIVVFGWQALFARLRGQGLSLHGAATAALVALFVPDTAPHWQLVIGLSFGVVLGEAVFGGRGRSFVQPVVLVLAFLIFSFADQPYRAGPELPLWTALPAVVVLIATGQAPVGTVLGAAAGLAGLSWLTGADPLAPLMSGALVLAVLYLTADPVTSGATAAGRWICGLLAGGTAALFATAGPAFGALVFATLLTSVFAPLIDHLALAVQVARLRRRERRLRHG
ncbi:RnfABCDGE type electron transport complex subunit D [Paenirhodobacter populi]|uniref:NADH-quinone reductase n=1 Tax=Paenirhodobacter populi TaxID=2306993 RepID=A0A443JKI0_9RHOB|nr:RnfABCDGE type electron transport complex subunit D [Sinirhodobacter populi]RWR21177.1 NADH-quinone reductase [Sinirhodobacter populi]